MEATVTDPVLTAAIVHFDDNFSDASVNYGLYGGKTGLILYYLYLFKYSGEQKHFDRMNDLIEESFSIINSHSNFFSSNSSFAEGLSGLGMVLIILTEEDMIDPDILETVDELCPVFEKMGDTWLENNVLDLFYGLFGLLQFLGSMPAGSSAYRLANKLTRKLLAAIPEEGPYYFLNDLPLFEEKQVNISLSHGNCGFLLVLLNLYERGICNDLIPAVADSVINYLLLLGNGANDSLSCSRYPYSITTHNQKWNFGNRLAWCYGDLNIVHVLYRAGMLFENKSYMTLADNLGAVASERMTSESTLVINSHFCHGSSGLATYYRILYNLSGRSCYEKAFHYWNEKTVEYLNHDLLTNHFANNYGILEGLAGPILSLLASKDKSLYKNWNKIFLL
ncbi:lanthionine synthetase LanC family protein [Mucilaginibacter sp.]|uniref:lanthionine synthetase LanC family protein n=1 Tax=Mucilaginibacter sp. TaxID=1882438 RepID=UPI0025E1795E|nr:lanthionine synthetase LanC family protein [Mucilaginibacter sp.]